VSMSDIQLVLELRRRIEVLEALIEGDPLIERVQHLEMRCGSLQSQLNLLRQNKPVGAAVVGAADKADAAAR
jgi:hypothetical protein